MKPTFISLLKSCHPIQLSRLLCIFKWHQICSLCWYKRETMELHKCNYVGYVKKQGGVHSWRSLAAGITQKDNSYSIYRRKKTDILLHFSLCVPWKDVIKVWMTWWAQDCCRFGWTTSLIFHAEVFWNLKLHPQSNEQLRGRNLQLFIAQNKWTNTDSNVNITRCSRRQSFFFSLMLAKLGKMLQEILFGSVEEPYFRFQSYTWNPCLLPVKLSLCLHANSMMSWAHHFKNGSFFCFVFY